MIRTLFLILFTTPCFAAFDLREMADSFVLETKKIDIPGHPYAFNPGIVRFGAAYLMSFRILPDQSQTFTSKIGLVLLDDNFDPISQPQILPLRSADSLVPSRAEDARLIAVRDKIYIVYDDNPDPKITKGGFRMYVAELSYDGERFFAENIEALTRFEGESQQRREKSWTPFSWQDLLLLSYSLQPHKVFFPLLDGSGSCDTIAVSSQEIHWPWGELRGGTPALLDSGQYLGIFHSSTNLETEQSRGKKTVHYFMGAYTFAKDPPFELTAISPKPIAGPDFYTGPDYKYYWKPIKCVFPCGYVADDSYLWVAYGRDDHEIWIAKLDKRGLLESLVPIQ